MLNAIWLVLILGAVVCGAWFGRMEAVAKQSIDSAKAAVTLCLGLVGVMSFWLGMMRVARDAGLLRSLARKMRPVIAWLFPSIPPDHPAASAVIMNVSANMIGLTNAATPFGLKAMTELDKINPHKGTATDEMALFLAINTSGLSLLPTGVIAVRAAMGSTNPGSILVPTLIATTLSTCAAIIAAKALARLPRYQIVLPPSDVLSSDAKIPVDPGISVSKDKKEEMEAATKPPVALPSEEEMGPDLQGLVIPWGLRVFSWIFWLAILGAAVLHVLRGVWDQMLGATSSFAAASSGVGALTDFSISIYALVSDFFSFWLLPILIAWISFFALSRKVKVYEALVTGAKEGFEMALRIIPYLVAILVAIGMFRASGGMDIVTYLLSPLTSLIGMPAEALPMAILRPLSGSGAFAVMSESIVTHGPDSLIGVMVSTIQGSTETTFYVLAVYYGAAQIKVIRHTLVACLIADVVGILAAVWICRAFFGSF